MASHSLLYATLVIPLFDMVSGRFAEAGKISLRIAFKIDRDKPVPFLELGIVFRRIASSIYPVRVLKLALPL